MEVDIGKVLALLVQKDQLRFTPTRNGTMMLYATPAAAKVLQSYDVQVNALSEQTRTLNPHVHYGKFDQLVDVYGVQGLQTGLGEKQLNASLVGIGKMEASVVVPNPSRGR